MYKLFRLNAIILAIVIAGPLQYAHAVPADPRPADYMLPDSSTITIQLFGDEFVSWRETADGYTLLFSGDGFLEYAEQDASGDIKPSGVRARNERQRTDAEKKFLNGRSKKLRYSRSQIETMQELRKARNNALESFGIQSVQSAPMQEQLSEVQAISGTVRIPIILVGFQGKPFTKSKSEFEMLFNQLNYTAGGRTGSLRDYFRANSYGQMDLQVDIFGPYTLPNPISYYDYNTTSLANTQEMASMAVDSMVLRGGANLSSYSNPNKSGYALAPHIIFAGYSQHRSGVQPGQSIWPHASTIRPERQHNGIRTDRYSCSAELRGSSGTNIENIGVVAHEIGHSVLGLPDFYDVGKEADGGQSVDLGAWDLMASGSNSNDGATPPYFSAYARVAVGWVEEKTLTTSTSITIPNPATEGVVYRINTPNSDEYFLLENRQKITGGWDAYIPASGLMIYHVDKNNPGWASSGTNYNKINSNPAKRGYYVKQAGCVTANGCTDRTKDPWPQGTHTSFTNTSTPDSRSWSGLYTNGQVSNITHNTSARTVSFSFSSSTQPVAQPTVQNPVFIEDFEESIHSFTIVNGSQTNKWHVGTATSAGGFKAAYISNDNGTSNAYTTGSSSITHMYRNVTFPSSNEPCTLKVNWRAQGENSIIPGAGPNDYLRVSFVETSVTPVAGTNISSGATLTYNLGGTSWNRANIIIPAAYNGTTKRLVLSWVNDGSLGTQPPAALDNIMIGAPPPPPPAQTVQNPIFTENFEGTTHSFTLVNGTQTNQWHVGTATAAGGTRSAYISNNSGTSNAYDITTSSIAHIYRDLILPTTAVACTLKFDWRAQGEGYGFSNYDYLKVSLVENSFTPTAGTDISSGTELGVYNLGGTFWNQESVVIPASNNGTTKRLVFTWINDNLIGTQPPIAVDNIMVGAPPPEPLTVQNPIFVENFEGTTHLFTLVNGTQTNQWRIGTATSAGGTRAAYISNDGGSTNAYSITASSIAHLYRDVVLPTSMAPCTLKFEWKGQGEKDYDFLRVYLTETSISPVAGTEMPNNTIVLGTYSEGGSNWNRVTIVIPESNNGTTKRLVFSWVNDESLGTQPPIAVDNIMLGAPPPPLPPPPPQTVLNPIFTENFEDATHSFTIVNGTQTNKWHIGSAAAAGGGTKSAYISNNSGVSNTYDITTSSIAHIYRDVLLPTLAVACTLKFDWRAQGESFTFEGSTFSYDFLRVSLVETSVTPTAGIETSSDATLGTYNLGGMNWNQASIVIPESNNGTTKRLVFSWVNDESLGAQFPIAIDNIVIGAPAPPAIITHPSNQIIEDGEIAKFTVATGLNGANSLSYQWQVSIDGGNTFSDVSGGTVATIISGGTVGGGNGPCTYNGVPIFCQWDTGCYAIDDIYSEPAGLTCAQYIANCQADGVLFTGVSGLSEVNEWGAWQQCSNLGGTEVGGSGNNSATYTTISAILEMSGYKYRCIVTNNYGLSDTSNVATLTVNQVTPIVTWPTTSDFAIANQVTQIPNGLNLQSASNFIVDIYGLKGNLISRQNFGRGVYMVSLGHLPKGMYVVKVNFGNEKQVLHILVR